MVSGSHSSPSRGSSHLSVALLSLLSVIREYLALRDGPRRFSRDFTWPDLLRYPPGGSSVFAYRTVTFCGQPFQAVLLTGYFVTPMWKALLPRRGNPRGLGCSRFARRYSGNRVFFLLLRLLRCFSLPGLPHCAYGFSTGQFRNPGINVCLTTTPGLSQSSTLVIAF